MHHQPFFPITAKTSDELTVTIFSCKSQTLWGFKNKSYIMRSAPWRGAAVHGVGTKLSGQHLHPNVARHHTGTLWKAIIEKMCLSDMKLMPPRAASTVTAVGPARLSYYRAANRSLGWKHLIWVSAWRQKCQKLHFYSAWKTFKTLEGELWEAAISHWPVASEPLQSLRAAEVQQIGGFCCSSISRRQETWNHL